MSEPHNHHAEQTLDRLLQQATRISVPEGAVEKLLSKLQHTPQLVTPNNIVTLRPKAYRTGMMIALPLAASFLFGVILGETGSLDSVISDSISMSDVVTDLEIDPISGSDEDIESNLT